MIFTNSPKNDDLSDVSLTMQYGNITSGEKKISYDYDQLGRIKNIIRSAGLNNTGQLSYEYDIHSWTKRISSNTFEEAGYDCVFRPIPVHQGSSTKLCQGLFLN